MGSARTEGLSSRQLATYAYAGHFIRSDVHLPELRAGESHCFNALAAIVDVARAPNSEINLAFPHLYEEGFQESSSAGKLQILNFTSTVFFVRPGQPTKVYYWCNEKAPGSAEFRHLLLDLVLPRVLASKGLMVLHGALLSRGKSGLALIGPTGSGKSTLATAMTKCGWELLSDDGFVVTIDGLRVRAAPTYRTLRLWPDSIRSLYPVPPPTSQMSEHSLKRRVQLRGRVRKEGVELSVIFHLTEAASELVNASRLAPGESCMSLVSNSFALDPADSGSAAVRLRTAAEITRRIPVSTLRYVRRYDRIGDICQEIERHQPGSARC